MRTMRHRRVWLTPALRTTDLRLADPAAAQRVVDWVQRGLPLVGRARVVGDLSGHMPLGWIGLADGVRTRFALGAPLRLLGRSEAPLPLHEAVHALPRAWQTFTWAMAERAQRELGSAPRVYGSAFWQHASGERYLHEHSDLDLLLAPPSAAAARACIDWLQAEQRDAPMRLDGEIELPSGHAVAWRELAGDAAQLLVKSDEGPALWPRAQVWDAWAAC